MATSSSTLTKTSETSSPLQGRITDRLADFPWWVLFILLAGVFLVYNFITNETYNEIIQTLIVGLWVTVYVTLSAYLIADIDWSIDRAGTALVECPDSQPGDALRADHPRRTDHRADFLRGPGCDPGVRNPCHQLGGNPTSKPRRAGCGK